MDYVMVKLGVLWGVAVAMRWILAWRKASPRENDQQCPKLQENFHRRGRTGVFWGRGVTQTSLAGSARKQVSCCDQEAEVQVTGSLGRYWELQLFF